MSVSRDLFSNGSIAHSTLRGHVQADRYSDGTAMRVAVPVADMRLKYGGAGTARQVLYGHKVCQLEVQQGLSRDETSGYVGYVRPSDLATWIAPTHRVRTQFTLLFDAPDFKSPNPVTLSCGSLVMVAAMAGKYARLHDGRYAISDHLVPVERTEPDLATTAARLIGSPYLWGGNSAFGIDCSGLVQLAMQAAGLACPGDSDQQREQLGEPLPDGAAMSRNDLVFWQGHVAIAEGPDMLIHANAHHMAVGREPLEAAIARIAAQGDGGVLVRRRL